MPSERFHHSTTAAAPPREAWRALQVASTWEAVAGVADVRDAEHDGAGLLRSYRFTAVAAGRRYPGQARTVVAEPLERMVVAIETAELDGSVEVMLGGRDGVTEVGVTLVIRSKSLFAGMLFPTIARTVGAGLPANVDAFAARLARQA